MKRKLNFLSNFLVNCSTEIAALTLLFCFVLIKIISPVNPVIFSDGFGYYAYLPALFIYHDFSYEFIHHYTQLYYPGSTLFDFRFDIDGSLVNRHFSGVSVLITPFFIVAHILAKFGVSQSDGYSSIYQYSVALAAIFYVYIAIKCMFKLLGNMGFNKLLSVLSILLVVFGTNLFHYCISEPSMSHVYSFSLVCIFLYLLQIFNSSGRKTIIALLLGIILGLILTTRPINILIVLVIPFINGSFKEFIQFLKNIFTFPSNLGPAILGALIPIMIQSMYWYLQTGSFFVYSYGRFGFNWNDPQIFPILFSIRTGLFVYTPILLLAIPGIFYFFKRDSFSTITTVVFILLFLYVVSSWEVWHYGMSYGFRPMVDIYAISIILLAGTLSLFKSKAWKSIILVPAFVLLAVNQIQAYQYRNYILHWSEMTVSTYKSVFLKTDKEYSGFLWNEEIPKVLESMTFKYDFEMRSPYWKKFIDTSYLRSAHSGSMVSKTYQKNQFSLTFRKSLNNFYTRDSLSLSISAFILTDTPKCDASLVVDIRSGDKSTFYEATNFKFTNAIEASKWSEVTIEVILPPKLNPTDEILFYLYNSSNDVVYMDDVTLKFESTTNTDKSIN